MKNSFQLDGYSIFLFNFLPQASIAQGLEHWSCKPGVESSNLSGGISFATFFFLFSRFFHVALIRRIFYLMLEKDIFLKKKINNGYTFCSRTKMKYLDNDCYETRRKSSPNLSFVPNSFERCMKLTTTIKKKTLKKIKNCKKLILLIRNAQK